ncbi:restriction endonuclease subunit S [Shewanella xiamenensis]|uniref:restriction endonuclease subunit S n=1 Tax=Shewanella xiamenensis TaxID=332186 RepID=UPI0004D6824A|nr:restriction endonuclease subunit S [Shewanella xiamenensis]KEK26592.1 restriction modification system DNA specificity domain-containing protein [Shewanella xiamenensis]
MSKQKKDLVPELRFPEFEKAPNWPCVRLNAVAKRSTSKNKGEKITRVLTNSAVDGVVDQRDYFDKDIAVKGNLESYYIVDKGDYVYNPRISSTAPVGPISKNKVGKGVMSPLYTVFSFNSKTNDFFEQFFKSSRWYSYLQTISNSGARHDRMSITNDEFMAMPVPNPSELEQQKIADCLASIDELIALHTQKLKALKDYKKWLMQQVFPAEGETVPKLRFPVFRTKGTWKIYPLGSVGENLDSKRVPITEKDRVKGNVPYYGASGVIDYVNDYIFDEQLLCISEDGANLRARTYPIAFSITGKTWVNNHAHVIRFEHKSTQTLVENYLNSVSLEDYLTGMAQPKLNRAKLDIIPIPLPSIEEQDVIADLLNSLNELVIHQISTLENLEKHKNGLVQMLFPCMDEVN